MRKSEIIFKKTNFDNESTMSESGKLYDDNKLIIRNKLDQNMRRENLQFLKEFITYHNFNIKSYFLACIYFDFILSKNFYRKYNNELKLDLIIISCGLLSSKFIENDPIVPNLRQIQKKNSLDSIYSINEIKKYEELCVKLLNYKLDHIQAYDYISLFFRIGVFTLDEKNTIKNSPDNLFNQCISILNEFSYEINFQEFSQLEIALASVSLIRETQGVDRWINLFEEIYQVKFEYFKNCYYVLKKSNSKLFQHKVNTYKKTELFLNLNLKDLNVQNLPFTPYKNKNSLSIFNFPNTARDKKLKPIDYLYSQLKSTDLKEINKNFSKEHEENEKEQQESVQKENYLNSKIIIKKRDMIREILKENSLSFRENLLKENIITNNETKNKENSDKFNSNESNSFVISSIGKITSLLKKRTMTSFIDSKVIQKENSPDIRSLIESYTKESNRDFSHKKINSNSSKIIPSLSKVMNIKKYQDSLTMKCAISESNINNKSLLRQNTIINIKKDLFPSMKSISINTASAKHVHKKTSCNIQEANTIYKKVNFFPSESLGDSKKYTNVLKPEIDIGKLKTNFLKDRVIFKKK
jgi:hypothetical protein